MLGLLMLPVKLGFTVIKSVRVGLGFALMPLKLAMGSRMRRRLRLSKLAFLALGALGVKRALDVADAQRDQTGR